MNVHVFETDRELGAAAARFAAEVIQESIRERDEAKVIAATGASQFHFLSELVKCPVDWSKTTFFHLDEYVGLPETHPASFRRYLYERLEAKVHPAGFHYISGDVPDPQLECERIGALLADCSIDVAFVGIGENGHIAFNDPPADFATDAPFIVVDLDEACRRQQMGEGWFASLEDVPRRAISMSVNQIMKSRTIVAVVPDARKARAVRDCLEKPIDSLTPCSILRKHAAVELFLDSESSDLLSESTRSKYGIGAR